MNRYSISCIKFDSIPIRDAPHPTSFHAGAAADGAGAGDWGGESLTGIFPCRVLDIYFSFYLCIFIYFFEYIYIYVYINIHTQRERERDRDTMNIYIYIYIIYIYIYTYVYIAYCCRLLPITHSRKFEVLGFSMLHGPPLLSRWQDWGVRCR